jgi:hypothetical protein
MRLRWVVVGWTGLALVGWLFSRNIWIDREATCDSSRSLFCFEPGDVTLVTGLFAAMIWFAGLLAIVLVAGLILLWKRLVSPDAP